MQTREGEEKMTPEQLDDLVRRLRAMRSQVEGACPDEAHRILPIIWHYIHDIFAAPEAIEAAEAEAAALREREAVLAEECNRLIQEVNETAFERSNALVEVDALREALKEAMGELMRQWESNYWEHCGARGPHDTCQWPTPAIVDRIRLILAAPARQQGSGPERPLTQDEERALIGAQRRSSKLVAKGAPVQKVSLSPAMKVTPDEEALAKELCFAICRTGSGLDFEAGCCSVCKQSSDCGGWVPFVSAARAHIAKYSSEPEQGGE